MRGLTMNGDETPVSFSDHTWARAVRCGNVYNDEGTLIQFFINGLPDTIRERVRHYRSEHPSVDLDELARYGDEVYAPFQSSAF